MKPKTFTFEGIEFEEVEFYEWFNSKAKKQFRLFDKNSLLRYFLPVNRKKPKKCEKCGHILEVLERQPLFGHPNGSKIPTHWFVFMKFPELNSEAGK